MEILPGLRTTSILLARAGHYDPDSDLEDAERAGAWTAWRKASLVSRPVDRPPHGRLGGLAAVAAPATPPPRSGAPAPATVGRPIVVANGFEADPGAQLDRTLMELDPHAVVEGLAFAAFAVGARRAFVAVRSSMTTAQRRLERAVEAATEAGYLGTDALGAGFDLLIEVVGVTGGYVVGEETVLLQRDREQARSTRAAPALPAGARAMGQADGRQQRRDAGRGAVDRRPTAHRRSAHAGTDHDPGDPGAADRRRRQARASPRCRQACRSKRLIEEVGGGLRSGRKLKAVPGRWSGGGFPSRRWLRTTPVRSGALEEGRHR